MTDIRSTFAQRGLIRPRDGRVVGGVCAGVGRRFGLTPWISRLLFVLLLMVVPGRASVDTGRRRVDLVDIG